MTDLHELYRDLHRHPELSFQEERTAGILSGRLRTLGFDTTTGVGRTGVVGVLRNGDGPTALLRADMDALPMQEKTGLPYASARRGVDHNGHDVDIFHACGHDIHVTCLIGAAGERAKRHGGDGQAALTGIARLRSSITGWRERNELPRSPSSVRLVTVIRFEKSPDAMR